MELVLDPSNVRDYRIFLRIKSMPHYDVRGSIARFPDEYASMIGETIQPVLAKNTYAPHSSCFDYQRDIAQMAIEKDRFCVFADCGLGKTLILLECAKHWLQILPTNKRILIVSPLMVIHQTVNESKMFYNDDLPIEILRANTLQSWLDGEGKRRIGIVNYDAMTDDIRPGKLGAMILDESSMLKSHYGKWGTTCVRLGRGVKYKLACTGTPAPNDRIEYANHAVFMGAFPTVNSFLAKFFVNRGQTDNRWEIKAHAVKPFYRALSHWCIFITNPATYGWKDNIEPLPPIHVHYHHIDLTDQQRGLAYDTTGDLFAHNAGGIMSRSVLSQVAKGHYKGSPIDSLKPEAIRNLRSEFADESAIIWCLYNAEQATMRKVMPDAGSIDGATPLDERERVIERFKSGELKTIIAKPKTLGFGLNLQVATRQIFSGLQDSYEGYYQAVKRSNRYGSTKPLNVHIPYTDIERPMIDTVMRKADRVDADTREQEAIFHDQFAR